MTRPQVVGADEVGVTDGWVRISAYPDGWVDTPVPGPTLEQVRRNGVEASMMLLAMAALVGIGVALGRLDLPDPLRTIASTLLGVGLLAWIAVGVATRFRWTGQRVTRWGRIRNPEPRVRHVPGVSWSEHADSAREYAARYEGVRLTTAEQVAAVVVDRQDRRYVVHVGLVDGTTRSYVGRSPRLAVILGGFAPLGPGALG